MGPMKRAQLGVLFLVVGALFAASPAFGASVKLTSTGVEGNASGQAHLSQVKLIGIGGIDHYAGTLTITCDGLTPNAQYTTTVGTFPTTHNGTLKAQGEIHFGVLPPLPTLIEVDVYNGAGQLVLWGTLRYK